MKPEYALEPKRYKNTDTTAYPFFRLVYFQALVYFTSGITTQAQVIESPFDGKPKSNIADKKKHHFVNKTSHIRNRWSA